MFVTDAGGLEDCLDLANHDHRCVYRHEPECIGAISARPPSQRRAPRGPRSKTTTRVPALERHCRGKQHVTLNKIHQWVSRRKTYYEDGTFLSEAPYCQLINNAKLYRTLPGVPANVGHFFSWLEQQKCWVLFSWFGNRMIISIDALGTLWVEDGTVDPRTSASKRWFV